MISVRGRYPAKGPMQENYPKIMGYCGGIPGHEPKSILAACQYWDVNPAGTIDDFAGRVRLQPAGAYWQLQFDSYVIGSAPRYKGDGVTIDSFLQRYGQLKELPRNPDYVFLNDGGMAVIVTEMINGNLQITSVKRCAFFWMLTSPARRDELTAMIQTLAPGAQVKGRGGATWIEFPGDAIPAATKRVEKALQLRAI